MTEFTIDGEGAISSVTSGSEFHVYDADSTKRLKKCTAAQLATYFATSPGAATGAVIDAEQYILQLADSTAANNTGLDSASATQVFVSPAGGQITLANNTTYFFRGVLHAHEYWHDLAHLGHGVRRHGDVCRTNGVSGFR
jgi:hypothetical protein